MAKLTDWSAPYERRSPWSKVTHFVGDKSPFLIFGTIGLTQLLVVITDPHHTNYGAMFNVGLNVGLIWMNIEKRIAAKTDKHFKSVTEQIDRLIVEAEVRDRYERKYGPL